MLSPIRIYLYKPAALARSPRRSRSLPAWRVLLGHFNPRRGNRRVQTAGVDITRTPTRPARPRAAYAQRVRRAAMPTLGTLCVPCAPRIPGRTWRTGHARAARGTRPPPGARISSGASAARGSSTTGCFFRIPAISARPGHGALVTRRYAFHARRAPQAHFGAR